MTSLIYRPLGNDGRDIVRGVARDTFQHRFEIFQGGGASTPRRHLESFFQDRLLRVSRFQSIIGSILLGIAVRLAVELFKYWIDQKFQSVQSDTFQPGEPGYTKRRR